MFEIKKRSLKELLDTPTEGDSQSQFVVPRFQRKYEWKKEEQVAALIDDIFSNLDKQYFLGPVIFYPSGQKVEIIDGQQRLATFVILFRALVDYIQTRRNEGAFSTVLPSEVEYLKSDIRKLIIKGRRRGVPVLRLSSKMDKDFKEIIFDENPQKIENFKKRPKGEHPAVRHLKNAYVKIFESFKERYNSLTEAALLDKLQDLVDAIEDKQLFIVLTVRSYNDAYTIFETINTRGKPLNLSNLVKIFCFEKLHTETDETYLDELETYWDDAEEQVSDFGAFIWHLWVSNYESCPKKQVFTKIEKRFRTLPKSEAERFIFDTIFDEAVWYHEYENPEEISGSDDIALAKKRYLEMLKTMGATRCYPLLLSIDYCVKEGKLTKKEANELLKRIACLTFWHSGVCERDARHLEGVYHKLAQETRNIGMQSLKVDVNPVLNALAKEFPSQDLCESSFVSKSFDNSTFAKIMLRAIDEKRYPTAEKTLKGNIAVWLEHILPKNPGKDSKWKKVFEDEKERVDYVGRLGNQTLLFKPINRTLSNKDFSEKKERYKDSEVGLTREIAQYDKWDKGTIEERTKKLFEEAKQVWPIYHE